MSKSIDTASLEDLLDKSRRDMAAASQGHQALMAKIARTKKPR